MKSLLSGFDKYDLLTICDQMLHKITREIPDGPALSGTINVALEICAEPLYTQSQIVSDQNNKWNTKEHGNRKEGVLSVMGTLLIS